MSPKDGSAEISKIPIQLKTKFRSFLIPSEEHYGFSLWKGRNQFHNNHYEDQHVNDRKLLLLMHIPEGKIERRREILLLNRRMQGNIIIAAINLINT